MNLSFFTLLIAGTGLTLVNAAEKRIFMDDVKALTLRQGKHTRGRRSTVPQLECLSGPCQQTPSVVQCRNVGSDGYQTQWKCEAEFPDGISFDQNSLIVSCEGYDYPDDPYITADSCGLQYSLIDRRGQNSRPSHSSYDNYIPGHSSDFNLSPSSGFSIWSVAFVALVCYVLYVAFCTGGENRGRQRQGRRYDGGDDYGGGPGGYGNGNSSCGNNVNPLAGGGFWQGLGLGGLAGYMMGGRPRFGYGGYGGYNRYRGGGMRFGGGHARRIGGGRAAAPRMGSGFAGTRRR